MTKTPSKTLPAVTDHPAQGKLFTAFDAVEVDAKKLVDSVKHEAESGNFAEFHFEGAKVTGVIKTGQCILKINN